jgi:hypothetical protein
MAREKQTARYARPNRREIDAHKALEAGVRELVHGKWVIPAPTYFQHNARQQRA